MVEKNLHSENGGSTNLQSVDYRYNIRGWLTSINNHNLNSDGGVTNDDTNDLFGMMLRYNTGLSTGAGTAQFNGNIGEITWREKQSNKLHGYGFSYDAMNRLKTAHYRHYNGSNWTASAENNRYNENIPSYDKNGNIQTLNRNSELGQIDNLSYTYEGNRLIRVHDTANASQGFINGSTSTTAIEYTYDANGNMITDLNKGISQINYNYLNLPQTVSINGATVNYTYDAQGQKLKKMAGITTTDYIGGIHYENNSVTFMQTAEGRLRKDGTAWVYEYNLKDHLGNVRVSFDKNPSTGLARLIQKDDYYPFGMTFNSYALSPQNKYKFQGQEEQVETGWVSFKWRNYDPTIGRFFNVDPLADKYVHNSTYAFAENKVTTFIELEGLEGLHYMEAMDDGSNKHVIEKNVVVLTRKSLDIPVGASEKQIAKIEKQNQKIEKNNSAKVDGVKSDLNKFFSGAENSAGEQVEFKFNVTGMAVDDTKGGTVGQLLGLTIENGLQSSKGVVPAAVMTTRSASGNHGSAAGNMINGISFGAPSGTVSHEVGHSLLLSDSYGGINGSGSGLMGTPPSSVSSSEVDEIIKNSYEK